MAGIERWAEAMASSVATLVVAVAVLSAVSVLGHDSRGVALRYRGGALLTGRVEVSLVFYGRIGRVQKSAVRTFLKSLNSRRGGAGPTVASWWGVVESYAPRARRAGGTQVRVGRVVSDTAYSVGKVLTTDFTRMLVDRASAGKRGRTLVVVVADRQVSVQEMCTGRCGQHGAFGNQPYVLVGNPETECPGACAWPFHRADTGPQGMVLQPPSGNVGADAIVLSLASALADAVTSPFGTGVSGYRDRHSGVVGPGTACPGIFGKGAFPGYTGAVRVDPRNGGAFNTHGLRGHKFLLPALWNPRTSTCWTPL